MEPNKKKYIKHICVNCGAVASCANKCPTCNRHIRGQGKPKCSNCKKDKGFLELDWILYTIKMMFGIDIHKNDFVGHVRRPARAVICRFLKMESKKEEK